MGGQVRSHGGGGVHQVQDLRSDQRGQGAQCGSQRRVGQHGGEESDRPHSEHGHRHVGHGHQQAEGDVLRAQRGPRDRCHGADAEQRGTYEEPDDGHDHDRQEDEQGHGDELGQQQSRPTDRADQQVPQRPHCSLSGDGVPRDHRHGDGQEHGQDQRQGGGRVQRAVVQHLGQEGGSLSRSRSDAGDLEEHGDDARQAGQDGDGHPRTRARDELAQLNGQHAWSLPSGG